MSVRAGFAAQKEAPKEAPKGAPKGRLSQVLAAGLECGAGPNLGLVAPVVPVAPVAPVAPVDAQFLDGWKVWGKPERKAFLAIEPYLEQARARRGNLGTPINIIDGSNLFYLEGRTSDGRPIFGKKAADLIRNAVFQAQGAKGPVIIVSSEDSYKKTMQIYERQIVEMTSGLWNDEANGKNWPLFFVTVSIQLCIWPENRAPGSSQENCLSRPPRQPGEKKKCVWKFYDGTEQGYEFGPEHLLCEYDDVLVSRLTEYFRGRDYRSKMIVHEDITQGVYASDYTQSYMIKDLRKLDDAVRFEVWYKDTNKPNESSRKMPRRDEGSSYDTGLNDTGNRAQKSSR